MAGLFRLLRLRGKAPKPGADLGYPGPERWCTSKAGYALEHELSENGARVLTMRDQWGACCPCFETLAQRCKCTARLAPQQVVVFQRVKPHPEEAAKRPSRRMGGNAGL